MPSPRKSIEQHRIEGSFRPARHGKLAAAPETKGAPAQPRNMTAEEKAVWDELLPHVVALGTAGESDGPALHELCRWTVRLRLLHTKPTVHSKDTTAAAAAFKVWWQLMNQFGLAGKISRDKLAISDGPSMAEKSEAFLDFFREPEKRTSSYEYIPPTPDEEDDDPLADLLK